MATKTSTRHIARSKGDIPFAIVNYAVFGLLALICAYPFYYLIINSVSLNDVSALGQVRWFPIGFQLENYAQVFKLQGLPMAAAVTVARTVLGTVLTVLASAYLGFMFTQERMWKRKLWYRVVIVTIRRMSGRAGTG